MVLDFGVRKLEGVERDFFMNLFEQARSLANSLPGSEFHPKTQRYALVLHNPSKEILSVGRNSLPNGYSYLASNPETLWNNFSQVDIHAEQNALINALSAHGPKKLRESSLVYARIEGDGLHASGELSCLECSKLAVQLGIEKFVLYHNDEVWGDEGVYAYTPQAFYNITGKNFSLPLEDFML